MNPFILQSMTPMAWTGFTLLVIWSLIWKGLALWKAAQRKDAAWYIVLLIVNTVGILEIVYYFFIAKNGSACCSIEDKK